MADVLGVVWAGGVHLLYGYLEWIAKQIFPDLSDRDVLLRQASLYGISPTPASYAAGSVTATGVNGSTILTGSYLTLGDQRYRVTSGGTISAGTATVSVQAVTAGAVGDVAAGVTLSWESPISGVSSTAIVASGGIAGGFDEESTDGVRDRLILRWREPPEGGADQDYEAWALAVAGVTRAWVYPVEQGLGTVVVRVVCDGQDGGILPSSATVSAVQTALDAQRPTTAEVHALAPTALPVAFTIHLSPDTADTRAAVAAELADLLYREAIPGGTVNGSAVGTIRLSRFTTAIGLAKGVDWFTLSSPSADVVPSAGQLPTLGAVTWA